MTTPIDIVCSCLYTFSLDFLSKSKKFLKENPQVSVTKLIQVSETNFQEAENETLSFINSRFPGCKNLLSNIAEDFQAKIKGSAMTTTFADSFFCKVFLKTATGCMSAPFFALEKGLSLNVVKHSFLSSLMVTINDCAWEEVENTTNDDILPCDSASVVMSEKNASEKDLKTVDTKYQDVLENLNVLPTVADTVKEEVHFSANATDDEEPMVSPAISEGSEFDKHSNLEDNTDPDETDSSVAEKSKLGAEPGNFGTI